ncbi:Venom protein [Caenorhabditis elegans]|nr:Venom protein [Caenorhabditis elegans]CCD61443.1 Venom protein [Caenorhabditis elegans]|eukprot:NP_001041104.1 Uncharacterized protein CELE_F21C10.11 [Caenorhabditis elegans]
MFGCFCDDCYWYPERLSLIDVARVKKDVQKSKLFPQKSSTK